MRRLERNCLGWRATLIIVDNAPDKVIATAKDELGLGWRLNIDGEGGYLWCWLESQSLQIIEIFVTFDLNQF